MTYGCLFLKVFVDSCLVERQINGEGEKEREGETSCEMVDVHTPTP